MTNPSPRRGRSAASISRVLEAFLVGACCWAWPANALDAPRLIASYSIAATLDTTEKKLQGIETLRFTNPSEDALSELKFHLYWNAFRNNHSTYFKESGDAGTSGWGSIDITSMTWEGRDLASGFRFESPDDGNPEDRTVLSVPLPRPVHPGETIDVAIAWKSIVPDLVMRSGRVRDFFFIGQWFPKLGVYEAAGVRRRETGGWNCHQYHALSEFYADFGDYHVEITLPERFVVASAGALVKETRSRGTKTLIFEQKAVHDFAFAADPRFVLLEKTLDPLKDLPASEIERAARLLGHTRAELTAGLHPVKLRVYMQPDHADQADRHVEAQLWALQWLGLYLFPYPYEQISIVDPPEDGLSASGMEYQTLYTTVTIKALGRWPFRTFLIPEDTTVHEFGHGYFYGLVASNEFEESWLDEGINTVVEYEIMDRKYASFLGFPFGVGFGTEEHEGRRHVASAVEVDQIVTPSWRYANASSWGRNSYRRPAEVLNQIRRLIGEEAFWRGLRAYAERWRYDHPTSQDFFDSLEAHLQDGSAAHASGFDTARLREVVQQTWYGTGGVDFEIMSATTEALDGFLGTDDSGKTREDKPAKAATLFDSRVLVARHGQISLPVDIVLTFANGRRHRTRWDGQTRWIRLTTVYGSRLVKAVVDPESRIILDANPWNNARYLKAWKGPSASRKVGVYAFHMFQILFSNLWAFT